MEPLGAKPRCRGAGAGCAALRQLVQPVAGPAVAHHSPWRTAEVAVDLLRVPLIRRSSVDLPNRTAQAAGHLRRPARSGQPHAPPSSTRKLLVNSALLLLRLRHPCRRRTAAAAGAVWAAKVRSAPRGRSAPRRTGRSTSTVVSRPDTNGRDEQQRDHPTVAGVDPPAPGRTQRQQRHDVRPPLPLTRPISSLPAVGMIVRMAWAADPAELAQLRNAERRGGLELAESPRGTRSAPPRRHRRPGAWGARAPPPSPG